MPYFPHTHKHGTYRLVAVPVRSKMLLIPIRAVGPEPFLLPFPSTFVSCVVFLSFLQFFSFLLLRFRLRLRIFTITTITIGWRTRLGVPHGRLFDRFVFKLRSFRFLVA